MYNSELAEKFVTDSGLKKIYIAEQMGLSAYGLQKKIDGITEFKASEINSFCRIVGIDDEQRNDIFFADIVACKSTKGKEEKWKRFL